MKMLTTNLQHFIISTNMEDLYRTRSKDFFEK